MNELVFNNGRGKDVTTSLIVAEVFEKNHADVLRDIRNLHCSDEFRELNFAECLNTIQLETGESRQKYFEITKDGFSFLALGYTGEKAGQFKETFIKEFNKRDQLLKNDDYILARSQEILTLRVRVLEQKLFAKDEQLRLQETVIEESIPKVEYYEEVLQGESKITTNVIAKELGLSARSLNDLLWKNKIIYRSGGAWVLYAQYQDKDYTRTKTFYFEDKMGITRTVIHTYWSEKGREFIHNVVKEIRRKVA